MAMDNKLRFIHMVGAIISIGWVLKLNSESSNDKQHHASHPLDMPLHHYQIFDYCVRATQRNIFY